MNKIISLITSISFFISINVRANEAINIISNTENPTESAELIELLNCLQSRHKINWELENSNIKTALKFETKFPDELILSRPLTIDKIFNRNGSSFALLCDSIASEIMNPNKQISTLTNQVEDKLVMKKPETDNFKKALPWLAVAGGLVLAALIFKNNSKSTSVKNIIIE